MRDLVVGFDLDMTLVDSADAIVDAVCHVCARYGVVPDEAAVRAGIGLPLDQVFPGLLPGVAYEQALQQYRERYTTHGAPRSVALSGAQDALTAVRDAGGRVVVVTAKHAHQAGLVLAAAGLAVDDVVGELFAEAKGGVLRERGAWAYVGDHVGDMRAAAVAGAHAVAVATGPTPTEQLWRAGAEVVLGDLAGFAAWFGPALLADRAAALATGLRELDSLLVAFSGGADSALLLAAAARVLGPDRVVAATAVSASLPAVEQDAAAGFSAALGVRHLFPGTAEIAREGYRANGADRCYHCKSELLDVLTPLAAELGLAAVATGTNADDLVAGFRPGIRAAAERGAVTPLADAGLTKAQVRLLSRDWGLPTWDKPQAACLSSRLAYGLTVTPARLARVERAEAALRDALDRAGIPVRDLRVRDIGDAARIEVDAAAVAAVTTCAPALAAVRESGYDTVEVDPSGFRSGSMNEALPGLAGG
jgi:pyridinium-3,5-biscarboxylic acid mononucleotide sulfurtransferase